MKKKDILQATVALLIAVFLINALIPFFTGSEKPLIVLSGSMVPLMMPGDMIVIKSVDPSELRVGDVLAFHPPKSKPDTLVTHRIISLEEGDERLFKTRGDANNAEDEFKVSASSAVGKLIFVIPFAGYLPEASKNKHLFMFMVILPALLLILDEIRNVALYSNPARARKVEREQKKAARGTSYVIKGKKLATLILISGLFFTGVVTCNMGDNGHVILGSKTKVDNSGFLSKVFVITTDNSEQKFAIHPWYGIVSPTNVTQITAPENTPAKISEVPYILPVFWIVMLAEINPYLPVAAEILGYTSVIILVFLPLWYKKTTFGKRRKRIRLHRLFAQWKRTLQLG